MKSRSVFARGAVRGVSEAVRGGSQVVEGVHNAVLDTVARGVRMPSAVPVITRLVYESIRGVAGIAGMTLEQTLNRLEHLPLKLYSEDERPLSPWQLNLLSAFNGAFGDHFHDSDHPWNLTLSFCHGGKVLPLEPDALARQLDPAAPSLTLFIHGLSMSDLAWQDARAISYGDKLEQTLGISTLNLRYNTGRHIHDNGRDLALALEQVLDAWPGPLREIRLVGHSMGGLVALSASAYGQRLQLRWPRRLRGIACLGAPHQGARLENVGNWFSHLLSYTPYTRPLAEAGHVRSAGIKDLRYGSLLAEDWAQRDPDGVERFTPHPVPALAGVDYLMVATTLRSKSPSALVRRLGDGLVIPRSALTPRLDDADRDPPATVQKHLLPGLGHLGLLHDHVVEEILRDWHGEDGDATETG